MRPDGLDLVEQVAPEVAVDAGEDRARVRDRPAAAQAVQRGREGVREARRVALPQDELRDARRRVVLLRLWDVERPRERVARPKDDGRDGGRYKQGAGTRRKSCPSLW